MGTNRAVWGPGRVIEYKVEGRSPRDEAFIANFGSHDQDGWKILRVKDGDSAEWTGNYPSADKAFDALRNASVDSPFIGSESVRSLRPPYTDGPMLGISCSRPGAPFSNGSSPETGVTECTGYIGNTVGPNGFSTGFSTRVISITITVSPPPIVPGEIFLTRGLAIC
jgi:hypothetical protein